MRTQETKPRTTAETHRRQESGGAKLETRPAARRSSLHEGPGASSAGAQHPVLQMQQRYGNRAVGRMLKLSRQSQNDAGVGSDIESSIRSAKGGGKALDSGARGQMESAFGADFSGVRVHTDAKADTLNRALNALAFTTGHDIFFRQGEYQPGSSSGKELLAHELTHVVQQGGAEVQGKMTVSRPGDPFEREADATAKRVTGFINSGPSASTDVSPARDSYISPQLDVLNRSLAVARERNHGPAISLLERSVDFATRQPNHPLVLGLRANTCTCGPKGDISRSPAGPDTIARAPGRSAVECINHNLSNAGIPWAIIAMLSAVCGLIGAVATSPTGPGAAAGGISAAAACAAVATGLTFGTVFGVMTACINDPSVEWVFSEEYEG